VGSGVTVTDDALNNQTDVTIPSGAGATSLDGLSDAAISSPVARQGLFHDGTNFVNQHSPGHFVSPESVSATTTADANERAYLVDASGGARIINLPTAVGRGGKEYFVKKTDSSANTVTLDPNGSEQINGASTLVLSTQNEFAVVESDGGNWFITSRSASGGGGGATTLDGLTDVVVSSPVIRQGLYHDGTNFVNQYEPGHFVSPESVSSNTAADAAERTYLVDASAGTRTITLPTAVGRAGKEYVVKKTDTSANVVAVQTTSSQTIDGAAAPWNIRFYNECLTFVSDNANWHITAESIDLPLEDIRDVVISSPADNEVLTYDSTSGNWVNQSPTGGGGGAAAPITVMSFWNPGNGILWSNMPAAVTELFGVTYFRGWVDLTDATEARLVVRQDATVGATNAEFRVQYSTNESTWNYLDGSTGPAVNVSTPASTTKKSNWQAITAGALGDVVLRIVGINGDGVLDPSFGGWAIQVR
jgi:hypothetical protein